MQHRTALFCFGLLCCGYVWHLEAPPLWNDEANTARFGRSILRTGVPSAWDGQQLIVFRDCHELSDTLLERKIPWAQHYVAAASVALFGDDVRGVRLLFALLACLAFWPLYDLLYRRGRHAPWIILAVLLSPQPFLFHRNARYFALVTLLWAASCWLAESPRLTSRPRLRLALLAANFILLFHTHPLIAACVVVALTLNTALCPSGLPAAAKLATAALPGALSWLLWLRAVSTAGTTAP